jgi:signal transduction histidine kinase
MKSRFFSGTAALIVALALVILVVVLAVLQHHWFGQLSEREGERMLSNLRNGAFRFSMEFEEELLGFRLLPGDAQFPSDRGFAFTLQQRLDTWKASTVYSPLVESVTVVDDSMGKAWNLEQGNLLAMPYPPGDWTNPFIDRSPWVTVHRGPAARVYVRRDLRAYCLPNEHQPPVGNTGYLIVVTIDIAYVKQTMIPQMLDLHLGGHSAADFDILIVNERDDTMSVLFASSGEAKNLSHDQVDLAIPLVGFPPDGMGSQRESGPPPREWFRGLGERASRQRPFPFPSLYEVRIRHRAGSLEAAVRQNRMINVGIGSGILLLLVAGVAFILIISRRAGRLAQQQIEFVAGVSHEIRTPLAVLQSVGDNLADGVVTDRAKTKSYGRIIRTEVHRLSAMVENALAYAGITSGKHVGDLRSVDLREIVRKACLASQVLLEGHEAQLDLQLPDNLPPIRGDGPALQSAIENLLNNAVKYSREQPWIGVTVDHDVEREELRVVVSDRGMGIAKQEIDHLFEPFYRGRDAMQRQIRGSGLGLNIVHHTVERHGGTITVDSAPGTGSTFVMHLPLHHTEKG